MSAVLLQANRRTVWLIAVQSALVAAAIAVVASAGARAGARIVGPDQALIGIIAVLLATVGAHARSSPG